MKTRFRYEGDDWSPEGRKITSPEALAAVRQCLENQGPVILEHWFYRGSCAPERRVFDDYDAFTEYLESCAFAGDSIYIWNYAAVCRDDNGLAHGKCPDEGGLVPRRGAY